MPHKLEVLQTMRDDLRSDVARQEYELLRTKLLLESVEDNIAKEGSHA